MSEASSIERQLAIAALIEARSRELGISRADLVRQAGFKNIARWLSPGFAVRFELDGKPKEIFGVAYRQQRATLFFKG